MIPRSYLSRLYIIAIIIFCFSAFSHSLLLQSAYVDTNVVSRRIGFVPLPLACLVSKDSQHPIPSYLSFFSILYLFRYYPLCYHDFCNVIHVLHCRYCACAFRWFLVNFSLHLWVLQAVCSCFCVCACYAHSFDGVWCRKQMPFGYVLAVVWERCSCSGSCSCGCCRKCCVACTLNIITWMVCFFRRARFLIAFRCLRGKFHEKAIRLCCLSASILLYSK